MNFGMITLNQMFGDRVKLCHMDTDGFVIYIETRDFYKDMLMMLKYGLIHLTLMKMIKDLFQQVGTKKYQVSLKIN